MMNIDPKVNQILGLADKQIGRLGIKTFVRKMVEKGYIMQVSTDGPVVGLTITVSDDSDDGKNAVEGQ